MNEENKQQSAPVSDHKRTALLRYMTVLFAVAFALVLLSYLIQVFSSRDTISQLSATSASALQNAERLQETNRELNDENKRLSGELENARASNLEYMESVAASLKTAKVEGWDQGAADTQAAYDLLVKAAVTQDEAERARLLKELESKESYLSDEAKEALKQLKAPKEPAATP